MISEPFLLGSNKPGPQGQVRDQWLCPYKPTGVMEYWSVDLRKEFLTFRLSPEICFLSAMKKGVFSITPPLQYSSAP